MKAVYHRAYGPPAKVLQVRDMPRPVPRADELLVRVKAASVHPDIWHAIVGRPYVLRLMGNGVRGPRKETRIPGTDLAGVVEAVGSNVTDYVQGDEVFGEVIRGFQWKGAGTWAEYAVIKAELAERKPDALSFAEAAAIPTSGMIALMTVRDEAYVKPGQHVLVNGAGGGVGMFVVMIAKAIGAKVTAVDSAAKAEMLRSIGADETIDYRATDFTTGDVLYDVIIDVASNKPWGDVRRVLSPEGRFVMVGHDHYGAKGRRVLGSIPRFLGLVARARFDKRIATFPDESHDEDPLAYLCSLASEGRLTAPVARVFPLGQAVEALGLLASGNARGKIVLTPST